MKLLRMVRIADIVKTHCLAEEFQLIGKGIY